MTQPSDNNIDPARAHLRASTRRHTPRIACGLFVMGAILVASLPGCIGYHVGANSLYTPQVRTIHIPIFQSDSFRRHLGERLTEAVVREVELKTPYKVVPRERADTVLSGRIVSDSKTVIAENRYDDPRDLDIGMRVLVSWSNRAGEPIHQGQMITLPQQLWDVTTTTHLTPEVGQSLTTAQQQAIGRIAEQIVSMMEIPW